MNGAELVILDWIQNMRFPVLDKIIIAITHTGDAGIIWIILTAIFLLFKKTRKMGIVMFVALFFDLILCNGLLKNLIARTRPYNVNTAIEIIVKKPSEYSFPSGHTAAAFTTMFALLFEKNNKIWRYVLIWACLIAFSRLYLYLHYPTDILGGILVGLVSGLLANIVVNKIRKIRESKKSMSTEESLTE